MSTKNNDKDRTKNKKLAQQKHRIPTMTLKQKCNEENGLLCCQMCDHTYEQMDSSSNKGEIIIN